MIRYVIVDLKLVNVKIMKNSDKYYNFETLNIQKEDVKNFNEYFINKLENKCILVIKILNDKIKILYGASCNLCYDSMTPSDYFKILLGHSTSNNPYIHSYNHCNFLSEASINGHDFVLEWVKNMNFMIKNFKYNPCILTVQYVSQLGHVHILNWYLYYGWNFKYALNAISFREKNKKVILWYYEHMEKKRKKIIRLLKHCTLLKNFTYSKYKAKNVYFKGYKKN